MIIVVCVVLILGVLGLGYITSASDIESWKIRKRFRKFRLNRR